MRRAVGLPERPGLLVRAVEDDTPAEAAGVEPGDRIAWLGRSTEAFFEIFFGAAKARVCLAPINSRLAAPEIAFILKEDLIGPDVTREQALAATAYVTPALEIIDSRVRDWKIKLGDTVADNASSARVVLGTTTTPVDAVDLRLVGCILEKNGEMVGTAAGAAALGACARATDVVVVASVSASARPAP
jgi:2-keto-4-pentenoate hydratase